MDKYFGRVVDLDESFTSVTASNSRITVGDILATIKHHLEGGTKEVHQAASKDAEVNTMEQLVNKTVAHATALDLNASTDPESPTVDKSVKEIVQVPADEAVVLQPSETVKTDEPVAVKAAVKKSSTKAAAPVEEKAK